VEGNSGDVEMNSSIPKDNSVGRKENP